MSSARARLDEAWSTGFPTITVRTEDLGVILDLVDRQEDLIKSAQSGLPSIRGAGV